MTPIRPGSEHAYALHPLGTITSGGISQMASLVAKKSFTRWLIACALLVYILFGSGLSAQLVPGVAVTGEVDLSAAYQTELKNKAPLNPKTPTQVAIMIGEAIDKGLNASTTTLNGYGPYIANFLLVLMMVWTGVKTLLSGKGLPDLFAEWVPIWVSYAVVTLFLTSVITTAPSANQAPVSSSAGQLIDGMLNGVASAVGGGIDLSKPSTAAVTTLQKVFKTMGDIAYMPTTMKTTGNMSWGEFFNGGAVLTIVNFLLVGIAKLVTVILVAIGGGIAVFNILLATISVKLVLALAPLMVPLLIFPFTAFIFEGWVTFLIVSGLLKIVAAFLMNITSGIFDAMTAQAEIIRQDANVSDFAGGSILNDLMIFGSIGFLALLSGLLLSQAPEIAKGLLSGSGGGGFKKLGAVTQSSGARAATAGGEKTGKGLIALGKGLGNMVKPSSPSPSPSAAGIGSNLATPVKTGTPSDIRLKTDITKVGELENGLPIYTYRYKSGGPILMGVMAHEVKVVLPQAYLERGADGVHDAVDYSKLTASPT